MPDDSLEGQRPVKPPTHPSKKIFVALDTTDLDHALALGRNLAGLVGGVKLGKEFFTALGPDGVRAVADLGMPVFLDLKFHDIPATVAGAVRAALALKPFMLNVHALGGAAMLRAAADAAGDGPDRPMVLAVTVLTSLGDEDLAAIGVANPSADQVLRLARLARDQGLDGVVCSAREAAALRDDLGPDFKLVVPGIRPEWAAADDQKRIVTPADAVALGADYLVIGRPITGAADPADAARRIADELGG
jgi:orotidine-5'-phosphate decarboxylase